MLFWVMAMALRAIVRIRKLDDKVETNHIYYSYCNTGNKTDKEEMPQDPDVATLTYPNSYCFNTI